MVATKGTADFLKEHGVAATLVNKVREGGEHIVKQLQSGDIKLVINTPEGTGPILDSAEIRSSATALKVPLFTTISAAEAAVDAIEYMKTHEAIGVRSLQDYLS